MILQGPLTGYHNKSSATATSWSHSWYFARFVSLLEILQGIKILQLYCAIGCPKPCPCPYKTNTCCLFNGKNFYDLTRSEAIRWKLIPKMFDCNWWWWWYLQMHQFSETNICMLSFRQRCNWAIYRASIEASPHSSSMCRWEQDLLLIYDNLALVCDFSLS